MEQWNNGVMECWSITDQPSHSRFALRMSTYSRKFTVFFCGYSGSAAVLHHSITPGSWGSNTAFTISPECMDSNAPCHSPSL
jgi:hypothetical protein